MGIVVGHQDAYSQSPNDVEEQDAPEDTTDGLGDVLVRVLSFTGGDGDRLHTPVRKGSVDERGENTQESACGSSGDDCLHGTRIHPVLESVTVLIRATTELN